jgi:hypothetical protein
MMCAIIEAIDVRVVYFHAAKLLRTYRLCQHAYRVAVWDSRHNLLGHRQFW